MNTSCSDDSSASKTTSAHTSSTKGRRSIQYDSILAVNNDKHRLKSSDEVSELKHQISLYEQKITKERSLYEQKINKERLIFEQKINKERSLYEQQINKERFKRKNLEEKFRKIHEASTGSPVLKITHAGLVPPATPLTTSIVLNSNDNNATSKKYSSDYARRQLQSTFQSSYIDQSDSQI